MIQRFLIVAGTLITVVSTLHASDATACSRMAWTTESHGVFAARSMDWGHSFDDVLFINSRGSKMTGGAGENSATWTSKYGNVVSSIYPYAKKKGMEIDDGATDGINEKGLTVHLLYLEATKYPEPNEMPGVSPFRWVRYALDNFATVAEAVEGMKKIRIAGIPLGKEILGGHLAMEDPSGDSAVFELIDGEMVIYHGKQYKVMTNDPTYDWQVTALKQYQGFGGQREIPGGVEGADRFVRLSHYLKHLPEPINSEQAAGYALSAIHSVAVPFGAPYYGRNGEKSTYPTWWTSVTDLKNKKYYFNWSKSPNIVWVDLNKIDFGEVEGKLTIDPKAPALVGDVSESFLPVNL